MGTLEPRKNVLMLMRAYCELPGDVRERCPLVLVGGRGFIVFRGVPVERYSMAEAAAAFLGIGAYFGKPVSQNGKGHILGHVKDLGRSVDDCT